MSLATFQKFGSLNWRTVRYPGAIQRGACALLEPSPTLSEAVAKLLESFGLEVERFEDVGAFQRGSVALRPSLIMMDAGFLNAKDGSLADMRACDKDGVQSRPPVIITAHAGGWEKIVEGLSAGADEYIIKPFDPQVLLSKLRCLGVI